MTNSVSLTKRMRKRKQRDGTVVEQLRYVLNYNSPKTSLRRQEFFERQKDAQARQSELQASLHIGTFVDPRLAPTVAVAVDHYMEDRKGRVKASTWQGYSVVVDHIKGPILICTPKERAHFTRTGTLPDKSRIRPSLGPIKLSELTTAQIRSWYRLLAETSGDYTAKRAVSHLRAILELTEEDFGIRGPSIPRNLNRARTRKRKAILTMDQIGTLLAHAKSDLDNGVYYAFPFLAGTRPSEQLGLTWADIDFEANLIHIQRILERDGTSTETTKTKAGTREIPMSPLLREILLAWRLRCPRKRGELGLVFPGPGRQQTWPLPRTSGGGPLVYQNFRKRYWVPIFRQLGLPYVTPHSARHSFISVMQAQGVEVGLVAQLAGHANPSVTLGHYTQAVRGGQEAVKALEGAYTTRHESGRS